MEPAEQFGPDVPLAKTSGEVIIHREIPIADVISYLCNRASNDNYTEMKSTLEIRRKMPFRGPSVPLKLEFLESPFCETTLPIWRQSKRRITPPTPKKSKRNRKTTGFIQEIRY